MSQPISPANISFVGGTPYAADYDDHYFSQDDGLAESRFVYLDGNHTAQRFAALTGSFHIVETGFGTGLNFLLTWQQFSELANQDARLYFTSIERHPLQKDDLRQALSNFPTLAPFAEALLKQWPHLARGMHRLHFGKVVLTLCFDDVETALPDLISPVDAWYLDGFAPAKNPQMWQAYLYQNMARLAKPYTTAASFTSANPVRRGLERWGFEVTHAPGFGRKRYMTQAVFNANKGPLRPQQGKHYWSLPTTNRPGRVAIIGAGIAGIQTAYALSQKGISTTVFDAQALCAGASGNRQGALYIRPSIATSPLAIWQATAYQYASRQLAQLDLAEDDYQRCGVLQLPLNDKDQQRQQTISNGHALYPRSMVEHIDAQRASQIAGATLDCGGLYFADGAWVYPKAWMQALNIAVKDGHTLSSIQRQQNAWQLDFENGHSEQFDQVVFCNGWQAQTFCPALQIKPIRGQVSRCATTVACHSVICSERYITPALASNEQHFGATYDLGSSHSEVSDADHQENIRELVARFGERPITITGGRASVRATTPDTLPYCGEIPNDGFADWIKQKQRQRLPISEQPPVASGLYVNTGHGSRGLATSALAGEVIACLISGDPLPVGQDLLAAIHPGRTWYKRIIKGQ
ncbi:bifunctional tRNA (5-methylaminomethyl-2-thiouridine)(34)-methyltransferase MnmD/FAD-dependent 5-carboxymethylaminomethyl-2-thiouridine(34) oxidoreductase MnmC [Salinibius halmophilus]|uniref:bifunctional tRNA (5-methylaminomethyl-2-thiouridine)(34)-methyltransferase MnmD/FAD-dependent 5-carboxymethylaminomethyl-2-thiouridine(34) oxidoreductase MnmC n=1 Tax=Salinibius halmophilus TaxID=1853216 RepID=UPI000E66EC35|nr:bifunctional tRNA (5-methylaminomethyl-2-thiouridine)(34)-methyltransferase MnmD/FAD-dependent 5-carboxymethylaminomethyl-2-thiouridine(34) oxidoreductase MnmC [Salinibius halmophilus]